MKKTLSFLGLAVALMLFTGCEKITEQSFNLQLTKDFNVNMEEGQTAFTFEEILSSLSNEELEQVKESIINYRLNSISYKVWEYGGAEAATLDGMLKFTKVSNENDFVSYEIPELLLSATSNDDARNTIEFTPEENEKIVGYLLDGNAIKILANGNVSEQPANFVLQVVADITATAEIEE